MLREGLTDYNIVMQEIDTIPIAIDYNCGIGKCNGAF